MQKAVLITGICGSGKTHYASSLSCPTISYDSVHNYSTGVTNYRRVKEWATRYADAPQVIIDAWGFGADPNLSVLRKLLKGNPRIEVRYLYMTPLQLHLMQMQKEVDGPARVFPTQEKRANLENHAKLLGKEMGNLSAGIIVPLARSGVPTQWLFRELLTLGSKITVSSDDRHLRSVVQKDPLSELLSWIDDVSGDPKYQTIEVDGKVIRPGYMRSAELWKRISRLGIDWSDKTVCDLGCFNGYFSFKAEQAGARKVVGYDCNEAAARIFRRLSLIKRSKCTFTKVDLSKEPVLGKPFDIALLLNSLHHIADCKDREQRFLAGVFSKSQEMLATINLKQVSTVREVAAKAGFILQGQADFPSRTGKDWRRVLYLKKG